ncbi:hypothetical protein D3C86_1483430 [compost metagenome]
MFGVVEVHAKACGIGRGDSAADGQHEGTGEDGPDLVVVAAMRQDGQRCAGEVLDGDGVHGELLRVWGKGASCPIPARRDAEDGAECPIEGGVGFVAGALRYVSERCLRARQRDRRAMHADALDRGVDCFSDHGAIDAVEVIGRQAGQVGQLVQVGVGVGVAGEPAQDGVEALGVEGSGFGLHACSLEGNVALAGLQILRFLLVLWRECEGS